MGTYVLKTNVVEYEQFKAIPEQISYIVGALRNLNFAAFWVEDLQRVYFWSNRDFPSQLDVGDWFRFVERLDDSTLMNIVPQKEFEENFTAFAEELRYDEDTLMKVYEELIDAGLTVDKARDAVTGMQNRGILFRERF